jgi:mannose/cellobiose epimerase-like protein (N-acyl-D-glucosamine 2-epimerase family)
MDEIGQVRSESSRSWPHAEALKALSVETKLGNCDYSELIASILTRFRAVYCLDRLDGGWVDQVDASDIPISKTMPASMLYHAYFGIAAAEPFATSGNTKGCAV